MKIDTGEFRVRESEPVDLSRRPTHAKPLCRSKKEYRRLLARQVKRLSALQNVLYAHDRYSLLVVFQAMDAAGKDSAIKHVMSGVNPQGCQVFSFSHPTPTELDHDFLWRTVRCLPERGRIGIFNRSYYEEVLIVRVHPEILRAQKLPGEALSDGQIWEHRFRSILDLESHLHHSGTRIIKFFLHLSREEQRKRLLKRIDDPEKNWKFDRRDIEERALWDEYMRAYEGCLEATSTDLAPWYVVPADDKPEARLIIAQVIVDALESLDLHYPTVDAERRRELKRLRRQLKR